MEDSKLVIEWPTSTCLAVRRANTKPVVVVVVFFWGGALAMVVYVQYLEIFIKREHS